MTPDGAPDYHALLRRMPGAAYRRRRIAEERDRGMCPIAALEAGRSVAVTITALAAAGRRRRFVPLSPAPAPAVLGAAWRGGPTRRIRQWRRLSRHCARRRAGGDAAPGRSELKVRAKFG